MSSCRVSKLRCPGTCRQRANAILYQSGSLMGSVHVNWYAVRRSCAASLLAEAVSKVSDLESDRSPWLWMIVTIREWNVRPLDSLDFKFLQIPWDFGFAANIAPRPPPLPSLFQGPRGGVPAGGPPPGPRGFQATRAHVKPWVTLRNIDISYFVLAHVYRDLSL